MQGRGFPITGSIIFTAGIAVALAAHGGDTSFMGPGHILAASPAFEAAAGSGGTKAESQIALEMPNVSEIPAQPGVESPQAPDVMTAPTVAAAGLIIQPTFHSSITNNPNRAAIEAMINRAIAIYESRFRDPITVKILFRYTNTFPNGQPFPSGQISQSDWVFYTVQWNTYFQALRADAKTNNDVLANDSLPANAMSTHIYATSANGRAVGLDTRPAMFGNGTVGSGGPYDGIVTLNSQAAFQFSRPPGGNNYDAQRFTEHEIDEVLGFGSYLNITGSSNFRPQDLFAWAARGSRNTSSADVRYFSINGGTTNIVNFNQNPNFEFGDWKSTVCPQANPYVQNASGCTGQFSDVTTTSPEGVTLDVIGYDSASSPTPDVNGDGRPDFVLYKPSTRGTVAWYLNNSVFIDGAVGRTLPAGWSLVSVEDFNRDGHPDYVLFKASTRQTAIWYLSGVTFLSSLFGPTLPSNWELVATGDFNNNGKPDYVLYNAITRQTVIWYLNNNVRVGGAVGPTLPAGWSLAAVADFNADGDLDYLLFNPSTHSSVIWYLSGITRIGSAFGPVIAAGYDLIGAADFDGNGRPDYLLYNPSTGRTVVWYMNDNVRIGSAFGPTLPPGWIVVAP